jgi:hypothetical protein
MSLTLLLVKAQQDFCSVLLVEAPDFSRGRTL